MNDKLMLTCVTVLHFTMKAAVLQCLFASVSACSQKQEKDDKLNQ